MTASGYILDRTCPANREHGKVFDMRTGGHYCSHHDHDFPEITKNFWTANEFEAAKSLATSEPVESPGRTKIKKPIRRPRRKR